MVVLLGPTTTADALYMVLSQRYKSASGAITAEFFPALPELFEKLDANGDGKLQKEEALTLNDIEPQISLAVDLGSQAAGQGLSLKSLAAELARGAESAENVALSLPGVQVSLSANPAVPPRPNYDMVAAANIARLDKDGNAYLEKSELPENMAAQFALWDADEDGKVYAKEIAAAYLWQSPRKPRRWWPASSARGTRSSRRSTPAATRGWASAK